MKVLQLIDSLEAGGAERVAVNYANALVNYIDGSYICATRKEGLLKKSLSKDVVYLFLKKRSTIDFVAIIRLRKFIIKNNIEIIHAHGSSYFLATIVRILTPKLKLIWHDHFGNRINCGLKSILILKLCSIFFSRVFVVNNDLKLWAEQNLFTKKVIFLRNYPMDNSNIIKTRLHGVENKKIVCLANFRPDKNHELLINAFGRIINAFPDWTLHLVGKDFNDEYSRSIKTLITNLNLNKSIYIYGSCMDTSSILKQAQIGVLSSSSEGLPLSLLEYGLLGLPVIATDVGQCAKVITNNINGLVVKAGNQDMYYNALKFYIENKDIREIYSQKFHKHIYNNYSEKETIKIILKSYK
ncbi:glycosyltransferase [Olleya marilimosa]|jgi:glycosyltransferase involved in cell wall biosynthesis|uniref:glycosyltransferase n=1 Tax=Olleya marilimosa TaxID=272164 RepID=UPI00047FB199|nr:glycosyltransferase [Olleya marilimosa]